jgi:hypothetical protein
VPCAVVVVVVAVDQPLLFPLLCGVALVFLSGSVCVSLWDDLSLQQVPVKLTSTQHHTRLKREREKENGVVLLACGVCVAWWFDRCARSLCLVVVVIVVVVVVVVCWLALVSF